ncbi:MAG TPA: transketolase C-terminal domain-containing protein [Syntrophorhabdales bacterium]|nr:transketolase C-terminal domain-containing protein [Syntrophorhabdales bacterium]
MREITYQQAVLEALREEFRRDEKTLYFGTNINYELRQEFGEARVRGTPISESGFVGAAVGLAGSGFRPVVDIGMATFGFVAMDQMVNQAAKITYMFGGQAKFPIVIRMTVGTGQFMAAQHSISPYPIYMNTPGLKIILPSTPRDVKGLLKTAIRDNNPVIYFEHRLLGDITGEVPEEEYTIPLGLAEVKRKGADVTVVALARMVHVALDAAAEMAKEDISLEVIDPRTLVPLDRAAIRASVAKTGRLVVVDEACATCGAAAEIISLVVEDEETYALLKSHPKRVCGPDIPIPFSPPLEQYVAPDREKLILALREVIKKSPQ